DIYGQEYANRRRERAERQILSPLCLDGPSFLIQQAGMLPEKVLQLTHDLQTADLGVELIVSGANENDAHLFTITDPGIPVCRNGVGFAAIGMGARHAESVFMFHQYTRYWAMDRALVLAYVAKRRAQVAPSVGQWTDLFYITAGGPHRIHFLDAQM